MSRVRYVGIALAVAGMCVGAVAFSVLASRNLCATPPAAPEQATFSWSRTKAVWLSILTKCGTAQAYTLFAESVAAENPKQQHNLAHVFGDALYDAEGPGGATTCDMQFTEGCFHGFFARAVQVSGIGVVQDLETTCYQQLTQGLAKNCVHGIGHGVLYLAGYTADNLSGALGTCTTLERPAARVYCAGGAFMEYNAHTLGNAIPRAETDNLRAPCDTVPGQFTEMCYFWQSQWWDTVFMGTSADPAPAVTKAATLCRQLTGIYYRSCFEGLGRVVPAAAQFDPTAAGALCDTAAAGDQPARLYCRAYLASLVYFAMHVPEQAFELCTPLSAPDQDTCKNYAWHSYNGIGPGPLEAPTK